MNNYVPLGGAFILAKGDSVRVIQSSFIGNINTGDLGVGITTRFLKNAYIQECVFSNNKGGLLGSVILIIFIALYQFY